MPKEGSRCIFLSLTFIDYAIKKGKNYCTQEFLEGWKNIVKEKQISRYVNNDLEVSSDDSDEEAPDEATIKI